MLPNVKDLLKNKEELLKALKEKGIGNAEVALKLLNNNDSFEIAKKRLLNRIDAWTANKITKGMVSDCVGYPVLYDTDRDTQYKLGLALGLVNAGVLQREYPEGFPCRGYKQIEAGVYEDEKTEHYFTAEAVIQWNAEFGEHLKKCTAEGWAKQAEINACTTIEELNAIVLE